MSLNSFKSKIFSGRRRLNNFGFSLMEMMIASGVMMVIIGALTDTILSQRREIKYLEQRQEIIDLKNVLMQNFSTAACTAQLKDLTFDGTTATLANQEITLPGNELRSGADLTAPVIAKMGQRLPASQTNILVGAVKFKNLVPTGNADEFKGVIEIQFDATSLLRSTKPLQIQKVVYAPETTAPTRKIANCASVDTIQSTVTQNTRVFKAADLPGLTGTWNCFGGCDVYDVKTYSIPIAAQTKDQYISISAIGVWDLTACGTCVSATHIDFQVNGVSARCGSGSTTGSSGPVRSNVSGSANCTVKIPANSAASFTLTFDGRGGQKFNSIEATYDSAVDKNTPIISFYSIN